MAIDVLLLPPDELSRNALAVRIIDADGVERSWSDGPVLVGRALTPGRHRLTVQWSAASLSNAEMLQAVVGVRTFTRPATAASSATVRVLATVPTAGEPAVTRVPVLLRIAPD